MPQAKRGAAWLAVSMWCAMVLSALWPHVGNGGVESWIWAAAPMVVATWAAISGVQKLKGVPGADPMVFRRFSGTMLILMCVTVLTRVMMASPADAPGVKPWNRVGREAWFLLVVAELIWFARGIDRTARGGVAQSQWVIAIGLCGGMWLSAAAVSFGTSSDDARTGFQVLDLLLRIGVATTVSMACLRLRSVFV